MRRIRLAIFLMLVVLQLLVLNLPPVLADTVFNPATDVIFEYDAEDGAVGTTPSRHFDAIGPNGPGRDSDSVDGYVHVDDAYARAGTKSLKFYQPPSAYKCDADRRVTARKYEYGFQPYERFGEIVGQNEVYWSWWARYDPSIMSGTTDTWLNLGGMKIRYGPTSDTDKYRNGIALHVEKSTGEFFIKRYKLFCLSAGATSSDYSEHYTGVYISNYLNTWAHFELYFRLSNTTTGGYRFFINDNSILDLTGYITDPRSDSRWTSSYEFRYDARGAPYNSVCVYTDTNQPECQAWVDDIVLSRTYVPSSYSIGNQPSDVGYQSSSWEDGFESGNFSAWSGTYLSGSHEAWVATSSTYSHGGTYSANFTTDGSHASHAGLRHIIKPTTEIFQRSAVRFEELPETDNTTFWVLRVAQSDGAWIASAGIERINGDYYWRVTEVGGTYNATWDNINPAQWHDLEFYFNATVNGNARLWVNGTLMCEITGDFSSSGRIGCVYPYIYINGAQASAKTVYHDDYQVCMHAYAYIRACGMHAIGSGKSIAFRVSAYSILNDEANSLQFVPLEGVKINGTRLTDSSGFCVWTSLKYNTTYTFAIECPQDYYPGWVLNSEGAFGWNGTHYIITHDTMETQSDCIEICFASAPNEVYIESSTHKLTAVASNSSCLEIHVAADNGETSELQIYLADRGHPRPYRIRGATDWSYDSLTEIMTVWTLHTSDEDVVIEWRQAMMGDVPK